MHIIIGIVLLTVALSFILVYVNTHPPQYPLYLPPSQYKVAYDDVVFVTDDGVTIRGWLVKPVQADILAPAIIICHGLGANKSDFTELAAMLSKRGYYALLFDFRGHGTSGGSRTSLGLHEQRDVAAALDFLRTVSGVDSRRIGIYGFSLGGATALLAAARTGAFSAVVADSAFTSLRDQAGDAITGFYHLPKFPFLELAILGYRLYFQASVADVAPVNVMGKISPAPVLLIAGEGDTTIAAANGRRLYAAAKEPKELWIIPHAEHGATLVAAGSEYEKRVGDFFDKYLQRK